MVLQTPTHIFFFFNDTATTEIYTLSLHDALPISVNADSRVHEAYIRDFVAGRVQPSEENGGKRSEEHTSELQSRLHLVCRLLLEKKKNTPRRPIQPEYTDRLVDLYTLTPRE